MAAPADALALRLDCRVRLHAGLVEFSILEEVFFRQPRPEQCPQHHCHLQLNFLSVVMHHFNAMISSFTSAKRSVAWRNSPLHKLLCVSQKVPCLTCALICHWRRAVGLPISRGCKCLRCSTFPYRSQSMARRSLNLIQQQHLLYAEGAEQCGCGWAVCIGWLDGKERRAREHTKSM